MWRWLFILQRDNHIAKLREASGGVFHAPDNEIVQLAGLSLQTMTDHYQQIDNISKSILEERSFASFMTTLIAGCTERQLIGIVQELNLYGEFFIIIGFKWYICICSLCY